MRIQKFLIIPLLIGSSLSPAFSQAEFPTQKATGRFGVTEQQLDLEARADAAEAKAKSAKQQAAAIRQNIEQLHKTFTIDPKLAARKQADLKVKLAQAEANGAKAEAEAARLRAESIREQAMMAAKTAEADATKKEGAAWLQKMSALAEQNFAKAEAEAARKSKVAAELTGEAQAAADAIAAKKQEEIRQARAKEEALRRIRESLLEQLKTGNDPAGAEPAEDPLVKALREKQAELDATRRQTRPVPSPTQRTVAPQSISTPQSSTVAPSNDPLIEALRQKQAELDAKGARVPSPSAAPAMRAEPKAASPAAEDLLMEALRRKQAELNAKEIGTARPPVAPPVRRVEPEIARPQPVIAQPAVDPAAEKQLVDALRKAQAELDAKERKTVARDAVSKPTQTEREQSEQRLRMIESQIKAQQSAAKEGPAVKAPAVKSSAVKIVEVPAPAPKPPVYQAPKAADLNTKEARLNELLRKYRADEITPREYHMERAKIVAEP